MKFLHLNDSEKQPSRSDPNYDKLYKIRPFLDIILRNFKANYIPDANLSVDESMISYKGRLSFLQYMPKKPTKWGMKAWVLADAANGYTWGWKLYTGKESEASHEHTLTHRVVLELVSDARLEGKGYTVYCDNFYSSPALFRDLYAHGFEACGTLRSNRKGVPDEIQTTNLQKGETYTTQDDMLLFMKWKDKRDVTMVSTFHDDTMLEKRRRTRLADGGVEVVKKPKMVEDYNMHMAGVDKSKVYTSYMKTIIIQLDFFVYNR